MTDPATETRARVWTVRQYEPHPETADDVSRNLHQAAARLREVIRTDGYVLSRESVTRGATQAIVLLDDEGNWRDAVGDEATGHIVDYSATATHRLSDEDEPTIEPVFTGDGVLTFAIPRPITDAGGGLRLRHNLDGPVTCYAYRDSGDRVGYQFAAQIDENTEQIELLPGAARVTVERDPEEDSE